jgi:hypothetical protein
MNEELSDQAKPQVLFSEVQDLEHLLVVLGHSLKPLTFQLAE